MDVLWLKAIQVYGKLIKPSNRVSLYATQLLRLVKTEMAGSDVSCVIDQDAQGKLVAVLVGDTAATQKTAHTLACTAMQTGDAEDRSSCPDRLFQLSTQQRYQKRGRQSCCHIEAFQKKRATVGFTKALRRGIS